MKSFYKVLLFSATVAMSATSCSGYLDVVPDEATKEEDTYADKNAGRDYLYSCYAELPNPSSTEGLDLLTGDEVTTSFEHENFSRFPKGTYTASDPVISYWNTLFKGIRQCYMFMENIDKFPDTSDAERADYRAQAKFLIAFYHYHLARNYGPIILVKEKPNENMTLADYPGRTSFDESVDWIVSLLDEAAAELPAKRAEQLRYGLATSVAAKALKAKLLLMAASPLFNGEKYKDFVDKDGNHLMPTAYDPQKWVKARDAIKEAIDLAEANGHALYTNQTYNNGNTSYPSGVVRCLRTNMIDYKGGPNPEMLLVDTRKQGLYDLQPKTLPKSTVDFGWNGVAPTWAMLQRFYTKNGLPWEIDPDVAAYHGDRKLDVVTIGSDHADYGKQGNQTIAFNLYREPRFYAWIGFQGGYYEVLNSDNSNPAYTAAYCDGWGRVVLDFTKNGYQGRGTRTNNYSPTGYLNKKGTNPGTSQPKSGWPTTVDYPWPIIRLADLYLAYAEALVETNDLATARTYLNKVRTRAGIPTVETSWALVGVTTFTQSQLRDIVRQERMIELYLENQNFWDMRRWLLAGQYFNVKGQGLNIEGTTVTDYAKVATVPFERAFSDRNYLMPIPIADVNRNPKIVQNPGY